VNLQQDQFRKKGSPALGIKVVRLDHLLVLNYAVITVAGTVSLHATPQQGGSTPARHGGWDHTTLNDGYLGPNLDEDRRVCNGRLHLR
jgi:hypothetical protein